MTVKDQLKILDNKIRQNQVFNKGLDSSEKQEGL